MADWAEVAKVVNEKMSELGILQRELSERSGVSIATIRKIQAGDNQRRSPAILSALSRALHLTDEHLQRVAYGDAPGRTDTAILSARVQTVESELADLRARVTKLEASSAAIPE